jgi:ribosomal-protein-alanine N-acetyltransferase
MIFTSERLAIRSLQLSDCQDFFDITGDKRVMSPIPQPILSRTESDAHLIEVIDNTAIDIFAITLKETGQFIGFCAVLKDNEILYRLKPSYWQKGYGKEVVAPLIEFCFKTLRLEYVTAEANETNIASVKILNRFMLPIEQYFNEELQCTNIRFRKKVSNGI